MERLSETEWNTIEAAIIRAEARREPNDVHPRCVVITVRDARALFDLARRTPPAVDKGADEMQAQLAELADECGGNH